MSDFFQTLRDGYQFVADRADHVRVDRQAIVAYSALLPDHPPANLLDLDHHFIGTDEETAAYILTLDALNFGSGYKPLLQAEGFKFLDDSIYFTVSSALKAAFDSRIIVTPDNCADILGFDTSKPNGAALAKLCAQSLSELQGLIQNGSYFNFVGNKAADLIQSLIALPLFQDTHDYKGRNIGFYKRAQIAAADLHLAFGHMGIDLYDDIHHLTMFADNAVPHVLKTDGVLIYTDDLSAKIKSCENIPSGSAEEVEIRGCAAHAVELIADIKGMRAMDIDHILWHRSAEDARYKSAPAHVTLTTDY